MAIAWDELAKGGIAKRTVERAVAEHDARLAPRLERLWAYYRNPARSVGRASRTLPKQGKGYTQAQEQGLPSRLIGARGNEVVDERARGTREIVIENDIAWRVQAMVDFVFGKPVLIQCAAKNQSTRRMIERLLDHVWERSGGIALLQDIGTLGHVYGHVDVALRVDEERLMAAGAAIAIMSSEGSDVSPESEAFEDLLRVAGNALRVEVIEPTRGVAILDDRDYRPPSITTKPKQVPRSVMRARAVRAAMVRIAGAVLSPLTAAFLAAAGKAAWDWCIGALRR